MEERSEPASAGLRVEAERLERVVGVERPQGRGVEVVEGGESGSDRGTDPDVHVEMPGRRIGSMEVGSRGEVDVGEHEHKHAWCRQSAAQPGPRR